MEVTLPQHILSSTDCRALWKIECLRNGMFCVSEGLAGHYALASRVEPEGWGVLPWDQAFTSTNSDSVRSVFQQSSNGCPFSMPPSSELYRGFFHPIVGTMPSIWVKEPSLWDGVWLPKMRVPRLHWKKSRVLYQHLENPTFFHFSSWYPVGRY